MNQGSPSRVRQLRPHHNVAGRWAPKGSRPQGHTDGAQFEAAASEQSPPQKNAARGKRSSKAAGSLSESQPGSTVEDSAVAAALPDNMLFVDGTLTTWTDTADRAIMLACLVQAQGHPSPEAFDDLVRQISESGCPVTLGQVRARFNWLLSKFLTNYHQQAA